MKWYIATPESKHCDRDREMCQQDGKAGEKAAQDRIHDASSRILVKRELYRFRQ